MWRLAYKDRLGQAVVGSRAGIGDTWWCIQVHLVNSIAHTWIALKVVLYREVTECFIFCFVEMKKATSVAFSMISCKIIKISHSDLINKVRGLRSDVNALAARQECHWSAIELALYWSGEVWQGRCKKKQIVNEENGWRESVQATIYPLNKWKMSQSSRRLLRIACKVSKNNKCIIICSTFQIWEAGIRQFGAFFEN